MPKRVLYVHFAPGIDGSVTSLTVLIKYLDRSRYTPLAVQAHPVLGREIQLFRQLGVQLDHVPVTLVWSGSWLCEANLRGRAWRAFRADAGATRYLERLRPDIVHVNDFPPVPFAISASELGIPVVWHCRHVHESSHSSLHPTRRLKREITMRAECIVAIAEPEAEQFATGNVRIVYNPIDLERVEQARGSGSTFRASFSISDDEYVVTAPIALNTQKGAWDFIRACGVAARLAPKVRFRFFLTGGVPTAGRRHLLRRFTGMGPEPAHERAERMIRAEGIQDRFFLTGFSDSIYTAIDGSDLVVFPSHLKACGRPCFEAGAFGKPILVTMPSNSTKVVLDGQTGLILPEAQPERLGEAIARLATHPDEGRRMGAAGLEYVPARFDGRSQANRMMAIYDEIV